MVNFEVSDILQLGGQGTKSTVFVGRVTAGTIRRGDYLQLESPNGHLKFKVREFGPFYHRAIELVTGDNASLVADWLDLTAVLGGIEVSIEDALATKSLRVVTSSDHDA